MSAQNAEAGQWTAIKMSTKASSTSNPIRRVLDQMVIKPAAGKDFIPLSIGDPTVFGNLNPPEHVSHVVATAISAGNKNGYGHSTGAEEVRRAISQKFGTLESPLTPSDIILASGCSGALELCIEVMGNPGDNILLPRPGFSLYQTICDSCGIEARFYNLLPERDWEIDLEHMESLIDERTKCIIINNPSNPCGSVFSREHLVAFAEVAKRRRIPVISDEIYYDMVFKGEEFVSLPSVAPDLPILVTSGIAKQFMVPGWRIGWIQIHDATGAFQMIRDGLVRLSTLIVGPNTLCQHTIPALLHETLPTYLEGVMEKLEEQAMYVFNTLSKTPGLRPIRPRGAMYIMIGVNTDQLDDVKDDADFAQKLILEESVFVLPGQCFGMKDFFRIVICAPLEKLAAACERISDFCERHRRT